jgi:ferritin-like metal-binding protein YciE
MEGLVEEGNEVIQEDGDPAVKDFALIGAAQKVEHYEIAAYGTARALAKSLGLEDVAVLLQTTLDEEGLTDKNLIALAEEITPATLEGAE